jgi:hypothetical protein
MSRLTRREFGKRLAVGATGFVFVQPDTALQTSVLQEGANSVPNEIAGYRLSEEDKRLAAKFLSNHEKTMAPLRETNLPYDLPPDIVYASPIMRRE